MAKVILICGKICCGKSTYGERLRAQEKAALLSVDELMLALFGQHAGEKHDDYTARVQAYLYQKSLELLAAGMRVILDWGFWTRESRCFARRFYEKRGIPLEFHYIDISERCWRERLKKRNAAVLNGQANAYFVDEGLSEKFSSLFEAPKREEIDCWLGEPELRALFGEKGVKEERRSHGADS
ncbi:MAG: ATP-binding protein [Provencibacterium sp.]|jgi:predicted kinase|nr:ATP-binding protein [Provencibacterium sp.]